MAMFKIGCHVALVVWKLVSALRWTAPAIAGGGEPTNESRSFALSIVAGADITKNADEAYSGSSSTLSTATSAGEGFILRLFGTRGFDGTPQPSE